MKYVFIIFALAVLIFIGVLIFNALKVKLKSRKLTDEIIHKSKEEQTEYAHKLGEMIRCKTVSEKDRYDDTEFKKLRETVESLFPLVHEKCERMIFSDDCWIYRLKGKDEN